MSTTRDRLYRRHRFPPEIISYAVWLYFRFPLSLRMVEEMLAARGVGVSYETVRQWAQKFGEPFSNQIRQRAPARGDKWHLDEVVISIAGEPYWLWRAVDQNGFVLDVLIQRRRDSHAARRLMAKLLRAAVAPPRVMITDNSDPMEPRWPRWVFASIIASTRFEQSRGELSPANKAT